jgi:3-deoxy-D-manno-octulosonic acid (KDO) 8-phosphate synthase
MNGCLDYLSRIDKEIRIKISDFVNPHYAMDLENFIVSVRSKHEKIIIRTQPAGRSFGYSTLPGEIKLKDWPATIKYVDTLNSILFSVQP